MNKGEKKGGNKSYNEFTIVIHAQFDVNGCSMINIRETFYQLEERVMRACNIMLPMIMSRTLLSHPSSTMTEAQSGLEPFMDNFILYTDRFFIVSFARKAQLCADPMTIQVHVPQHKLVHSRSHSKNNKTCAMHTL